MEIKAYPTLEQFSFGYNVNALRQRPKRPSKKKSEVISGYEQFGRRIIEGTEYFLFNGPYAYPLQPDTTIDTVIQNLWFVSEQVSDPTNPERILNIMNYSQEFRREFIKEEKSIG